MADVKTIAGEVSGVEEVQAYLASKRAIVTYRDGTEVENEVRDRLTRAGHTVG